MLGDKKIKDIIEKGDIEITVFFDYKKNVPTQCDNEVPLLDSSLASNIYSDRLKLTLGPIIKILSKVPVRKKNRFKHNRALYDLRKSDNKYLIKPGESIIILTNEKIKLNDKFACLVVPRVSLSDVGVIVTTAYVDPYYNGLMRLHLSNISDKTYELNFLEPIAQCFFFEISGDVSKEFKEKFVEKSTFFGQTWPGIVNSDRDPFPTKKGSVESNKLENVKTQIDTIASFVKRHSLIFLLLINFFTIASVFVAFNQEFTKYTNITKQIELSLQPYSSEIIINSGKKYGEKVVTIDCEKDNIITVLCSNDEIHYKILSDTSNKKTKIIFSLSLTSETVDIYQTNFTYNIIRRVK